MSKTPEKPKPQTPLAPPPRSVPLTVRLGLMFGGCLNQLGWALFGFGMLIYWGMASEIDFESVFFWTKLARTPGRITAIAETNTKVNDNTVCKHDYKFKLNGVEYTGSSYGPKRDIDKPVMIEYPVGNPERSRIEDMRTKPMPLALVVLVVIPLIGLAMLSFGFRSGRKAARLLAIGEEAVGKCVGRAKTNTTINDSPVIKYTFEFPVADGSVYQTTASSHVAEDFADDRQPLLYDPANPGEATVLAQLSFRPETDDLGQIKPRGVVRTFALMVVPTLTFVVNTMIAVTRLAQGL